MKRKFLFIALAFVAGFGFMSAEMESTATGSITVTVLDDGAPSVEALVGVATTAENLENSVYIAEGETNAKGMITFNSIAAGTYYIDAANEDFYGEATVVVADGNATVTVNLTEE